MLSWLRALRRPPVLEPGPEPSTEVERPEWVDELLDAIQKQSRASVKQAARFEAALAERIPGAPLLYWT